MAAHFLTPWMLAGLAAFAIPILIELIFRRRRRQFDLPTLRYLLRDPARKKVQQQDRLLLFLRCLVPVVLAAALARPLLAPGETVRNRHVILVIDATSSMGQQVDVSTSFALARNRAGRLIGILPPGTKLSVLALGHQPEIRLERSTDLYAARELVEGMKITHGAAALADALPVLQKWLEEGGPDETAEVYLFSDFQKTTVLRKDASGADPVAGLRKLCGAAQVSLVDVGGERSFNYYFTDLAPEDPLLVARRTVFFRATVNAAGTPTIPDPKARVTFLVNQVQQGVREVPLSSGSATVVFEHRFPAAGEYEIEVVVEGDTHRLDNHRYYLASVPESLKVLILAEPAASTPEAAFLAAAISPRERPGLDAFSIFSSKIIPPAGLLREDLGDRAAVIVLGMSRVPPDVAARLESYVRDGGNAVFFLSSQSNPFEYNEQFFKEGKGLLPAALGKIEEAEKGRGGMKRSAAVHPALAFSSDEKPLGDPDILRFMSLAPGAIKERVIASFGDGQPALLESRFGRGQVMMCCTAAGPPDNFLPASPAYPVLLQEILRYLAGNPDRAVNLQIGQAFRQDVLITTQHLVLRKPDGSKTRLTPVQTGADPLPAVVFDQTDQMGLYAIDAQPDVVKRPRFVVNLQPTESDLDRLSEAEAGQLLPEAAWVRSRSVIEEVVRNPSAQVELAGPLLWGLAALLAFETLLAVRFGMRRHSVRGAHG